MHYKRNQQFYKFNKNMSQQTGFADQLPCGGSVEQDKIIQKNMKVLSEEYALTKHQIKEEKQQQQQCTECDKQKPYKEAKNCKTSCCMTNLSLNEHKNEQSQCCTDCQCSNDKKIQTKKEEKQAKQNIQNVKAARTLCKKCKLLPGALIHKNQPICRQCLLKNIEYKCRLTLQNSMKVTQKSKILICFSGGLNSICLVNILSSLKKRYQKHHLFGQLRAIHIQQQSNIPENYKQLFQGELGINLQVIKIEQVFEGQTKSLQEVRNIFSMFNKSANTADLLALFRDRLVVRYAKQNNFDFIVKGLNGQSIATSIFKYFAKGIGGDVTELSSRQQDSLYHYPLRQHLQKQLQYYFYTLKCSKLSLISQPDDLSFHCSTELDDHLNDFILHLQTMYSHTAPAITRTSEKIESNRKNQIRCQWCMFKGVIDPYKLCRKCDRMYQCKTKNFDITMLPQWFIVQK